MSFTLCHLSFIPPHIQVRSLLPELPGDSAYFCYRWYLTEAEDIMKRWQEYTEELYKKDLHDPDNHNGVITDLEPDILECEVKWALESITKTKILFHDWPKTCPAHTLWRNCRWTTQLVQEDVSGGRWWFHFS